MAPRCFGRVPALQCWRVMPILRAMFAEAGIGQSRGTVRACGVRYLPWVRSPSRTDHSALRAAGSAGAHVGGWPSGRARGRLRVQIVARSVQ